jgi:hypothetical protein
MSAEIHEGCLSLNSRRVEVQKRNTPLVCQGLASPACPSLDVPLHAPLLQNLGLCSSPACSTQAVMTVRLATSIHGLSLLRATLMGPLHTLCSAWPAGSQSLIWSRG